VSVSNKNSSVTHLPVAATKQIIFCGIRAGKITSFILIHQRRHEVNRVSILDGKTGSGIRNLWLEGPVSISASPGISQSYTQSGIFAQNVTHCFVEGCRFSGWEGAAIFFQDATACRVLRNTFTDAKTQPARTDNFGSVDIVFWKSCVDNIIDGNIGESGASYHVILQTVTAAAQTSLRNHITNNTTVGNKVYGIMVYNILSSTHVIESTVISGNTIRDVQGFYNNPAPPGTNRDYGAGIYLLSCEKTICTNNIVENTCTLTDGSTLTPAGISMNGVSAITVSNNRITTSAWYGIFCTDTLQLGAGTGSGTSGYVPSDFTIIEGNTIKSSTKHGIYVRDKHKVRVVGNTVDTVSGASMSGIVFESTLTGTTYPTLKWNSCDSNSIYSVASTAISVSTSTGISVCNNQMESGIEGIFLETIDAVVANNNIRNFTTGAGRGIDLRSTSSSANSMINGNMVTGCTLGILASHTAIYGENRISSNTTNFSGVYAPWISTTFNPPSIAAGGTTTTTLTVTGAALGDFVEASFSLDLQGIQMRAYVSAADTVTFVFQNPTAGAIDLASGTLRAKLRKL